MGLCEAGMVNVTLLGMLATFVIGLGLGVIVRAMDRRDAKRSALTSGS